MECPACSYQNREPLLRCPSCGRFYDRAELEKLHHLRFLRARLQSWREQGVRLVFPGRTINDISRVISDIDQEITETGERIGIHGGPAEAAAPAAPRPQEPSAHTPTVVPQPSVPPRHPALARPPVGARTVQARFEAAPRAEGLRWSSPSISWAKVGEALLSRRSLQAFLYIGAVLFVVSALVLVVRLWDDLHWAGRQAILAAGMVGLFWVGYQVREKMGLWLSGGAIMDIAALWVPLNVAVLLFQFMGWEGGASVPGLDIPLGLAPVGWMTIALVSAPVHAYLSYRFNLLFLVHTAAIAGAGAVIAALAALGAPVGWQLAGASFLSPLYAVLGAFLAKRERPAAAAHLMAFTHFTVRAVSMAIAVMASLDEAPWGAFTAVTWALFAFYATSYWVDKKEAHRHLTAVALPLAVLTTLAVHTPIPMAWYNVVLVSGAAVYMGAVKLLQSRGVWPKTEWKAAIGAYSISINPADAVVGAMSIAAVAWPIATVPSAATTIYALAALTALGAALNRNERLAIASTVFLFTAVGLTLYWTEAGLHWRAMALAPLALLFLAGSEVGLALTGQRGRRTREILDPANAQSMVESGPSGAFVRPFFVSGAASAIAAMIFGAFDLFTVGGGATDGEGGGLQFVGADPAPWTYLMVAGLLGVWAYFRRNNIFSLAAALSFLAFVLLLSERGFFLEVDLTQEWLFMVLGVLSAPYLIIGLVLDRVRSDHSKVFHAVGHALLLAAVFGTIPHKDLSVAAVGIAAAAYAFSAYLTHRNSSHSLGNFIGAYASSLFIYLAIGTAAALVMLGVSYADPGPGWYGLAAAGLSTAILVYGHAAQARGWSQHIHLHGRLYGIGVAWSAAAVGVSATDPTLRVAVSGLLALVYLGSAGYTRQALWVYPASILVATAMAFAMLRADIQPGMIGVGLTGLAALMGAASLARRPDGDRSWSRAALIAPESAALPLTLVGALAALAGVGLAGADAKPVAVAALAVSSVYFLTSAVYFRTGWLLYPMVGLLAASYGVGLTISGVETSYYGVLVLPGTALSMIIGLILSQYPRLGSPKDWFLRTRSHIQTFSNIPSWLGEPAAPFVLAAYAGSLAAISASAGTEWPLFGAFLAAAFLFGYSAWRYRAPLWMFAALAAVHGAFLRLLFNVDENMSTGEVGGYWVLLTALLALGGALAARNWSTIVLNVIKGRPPSIRDAASDWTLPWASFALLGAPVSTALASFDPMTGLLAGLVYGAALGGIAFYVRSEWTAWASLAFLGLGFGHGMDLANVPALDIPIYIAAIAVVITALRYARRLSSAELGSPITDSWNRPLRYASYAIFVCVPFIGLGLWGSNGGATDDLQPLVLTLAVVGLGLAGAAYVDRLKRMAYVGVAVLIASYMTQLVIFDQGQPQLFVGPAALFLLAVTYFERQYRRSMPVAAIEAAGILLLLGVTFLQSLGLFTYGVDGHIYGFILAFESLAVIAWGAALRWKRPFFGGIAAFGANLVVLIFNPLVQAGSPTLMWAIFGGLGAVLLAAAAYLERNREKTSAAFRRIADRLDTWE